MAKPYALYAADAGVLTATGDQTEEHGVPVRRFRKDIASVGTYKHPIYGWTLQITADRLDQWAGAFSRMLENGVNVPVVVDHKRDSDSTIGHIVSMERDGDTLFAIHEIVGQRGLDLVDTVGLTSPWIDREFTDGKGRRYGEVIVHSSLTPEPVIPGQDAFRAIAASLKPLGAEAIFLSQQEPDMDLSTLRELLGAGDELTDENATEMIAARIRDADGGKTEAETQLTASLSKVEQLEAKVRELEKAKPDDEVLEGLIESTEAAIDTLVERGVLSPAKAASLKPIIIGAEDNRNVYAMSRTFSGLPKAMAKQITEWLADFKSPPAPGEETESQTMALHMKAKDEAAAASAKAKADTAAGIAKYAGR